MADIFRRYGPPYRAKYGDRMLPSHRQAMGAIERCRTLALGGHVYACEACGETQYQYHSCRNRHCPKCQNGKAQLWLEKQQVLLLPVPHFLVTVTLPSELRRVARSHQKLVYDLFFRTPAAAMQHLARDPRFVGGQMGMVGVVDSCSPFVVSPEGVALGNEIPDSMVMIYPDEQVEKFLGSASGATEITGRMLMCTLRFMVGAVLEDGQSLLELSQGSSTPTPTPAPGEEAKPLVIQFAGIQQGDALAVSISYVLDEETYGPAVDLVTGSVNVSKPSE